MIKKLKNFFGLKKVPFSKNTAASELFKSQVDSVIKCNNYNILTSH